MQSDRNAKASVIPAQVNLLDFLRLFFQKESLKGTILAKITEQKQEGLSKLLSCTAQQAYCVTPAVAQ